MCKQEKKGKKVRKCGEKGMFLRSYPHYTQGFPQKFINRGKFSTGVEKEEEKVWKGEVKVVKMGL